MEQQAHKDKTAPRVDQDPYNFTPSQVATTYAGSVSNEPYQPSHGDPDGTETKISTFSYQSDRDALKYLREAHGRRHSDKQHTAIILGMGGLYPAAEQVRAILQPEPGVTKRILDLGCGTGVWTLAMSLEHPHAEVIGVDLSPCPISADELPANCRFEVDDINLGLMHFENQFDIVHIRLVGSGIKDFRQTMGDIEGCLKPGGMVIWIDIDYDLYSHDTFTYTPVASELQPSGAWLQRPLYEMRRSAVLGGSDVHTMEKVLDEEGLWDRPLIDPETQNASMYLPLGPWGKSDDPIEDQYLRYVGALMRQDITSGHRAVHPLLIRSGWTKETVNEWSDKADRELASMEHEMSLRIRLAWGRRRLGPGKPAPPLPTVQLDDSNSPSRRYFPYFFVHDTKEESIRQTANRNRDKLKEVPFHPKSARTVGKE
ncbi:hypothetical protein FRC17_009400 [Serendipita sp. 399]|nr:hypothetical protein FRC17_009400 [Serendipita sp. 399]